MVISGVPSLNKVAKEAMIFLPFSFSFSNKVLQIRAMKDYKKKLLSLTMIILFSIIKSIMMAHIYTHI